VYETMVEPGIAEKLDKEIMQNIGGKETTNKNKMYGRPTKYRLTHPKELLFVDETGCNTTMKQDEHVGGEMFLLPCEDKESEIAAAVTDTPFYVLSFSSGTNEPVLCAVIFKSNKDVDNIPYTWRLGIDLAKDVTTGTTTAE
jgi:hypothetical protein